MLNKDILSIVAENIEVTRPINLQSIRNVFSEMVVEKEKFKNAYLLLYIYNNFCINHDVQTRKTSARDFEDFVSVLTLGKVADSSARHNNTKDNIFIENNFITEWAINNKREKTDIIYENAYGLAIKTLQDSNKELNMGAFEKKALFSEMNVVEYLEERISSQNGIGLGSKPQLLKLLNKIKSDGYWNKFTNRFLNMCKYIYSDDILLFIKSTNNPRIYLIESSKFIEIIKEYSDSPDNFTKLVNRWEGNNIRMNRDSIIRNIEPIVLDFEFLNNHVISIINENVYLIMKNFILYIEDPNRSTAYRKKIYSICDETLNEIDINLKKLKS